MAPEVLNVKETQEEYSKKADVWCLGLILIEMLTGKIPKFDMSTERDKRLPKHEGVSRELMRLCRRMIIKKPQLRASLF